jgi:hypothetical protein
MNKSDNKKRGAPATPSSDKESAPATPSSEVNVKNAGHTPYPLTKKAKTYEDFESLRPSPTKVSPLKVDTPLIEGNATPMKADPPMIIRKFTHGSTVIAILLINAIKLKDFMDDITKQGKKKGEIIIITSFLSTNTNTTIF